MFRFINQVGIQVPDLEVGKTFYEEFGLTSNMVRDNLVFRCKGKDQDQIVLMKGSDKKLCYSSFGTDEKSFEWIKINLKQKNIDFTTSSPFKVDLGGIWVQDPFKDWIHIFVGEEALSTLYNAPEINSPGNYRRIGIRACTPETINKKATPRRLGHLIKFSPDVEKSSEFYCRAFGLKVSDSAPGVLAFLYSPHGGDHHMIAFAKSSHTGLHHISFEVADIDEIEIGAQNLIKKGYKDAFGLGRHVGGSNYFHYIRDPWNSLVEYFWDIDRIEAGTEFETLVGSPHDLTMVWGMTPPPPEFVINYEKQ